MASYKKRGYKPNNKAEREEKIENESTTAEVFKTLDEGASSTEKFLAQYQKPIFGVIIVIAVVILGFLGYQKFIQEPNEEEAANEMNQAQQYFDSALQATGAQQDSLFTRALQGGNGKFGFEDISSDYSGTKAGELANYYAGIAHLNIGNYQQAIDYLDKFNVDDEILTPLAKGSIGDAFLQLGQPEEALGYFEQAANMRTNGFTTPKFLMKAAVTAISLKDGDTAEKHLNRIKDEFPDSEEANTVEVYLGQAEVL
ncbi:tetratricopeptide repeat protein [Psychroflexus sp. YR1-1]|uniref:Tetratricopeptide repeat protein n=1 Tax=Psychroflexus aurantiacus TaxID=2709310 RepID=A0A6B3R3S0_9FLAO|nr:tetratricopeptide repeat protein [Psychroflexus aurantiacus]NEV93495.1 tetratricopeptide repeat protein [Psychroflexus aurantiacus]